MVERFNGRIEEVLQSHHAPSGDELETTLNRSVWPTIRSSHGSALGSRLPLQAMKEWHNLKPELLRKRPYYLKGCDTWEISDEGEAMYTSETLLDWQKDQYEHDMRNHFDILSLHKEDRLKHYAMHFAKYAGRLARGGNEKKPTRATFVDALLVCLSAANTLHQKLAYSANRTNNPMLIRLTDAAGRFNDAAEKIDHMEPFLDTARQSNQDILDTLLDFVVSKTIDVEKTLQARRSELRERQFFIR